MSNLNFQFQGISLVARATGSLWWPDAQLLCVSDLHLGKSERIARRSGSLLPPYESHDTLVRLQDELNTTGATSVICLGDSFDDLQAAQDIGGDLRHWLNRLCAGRDWTWIEGNHDPGPVELPGSHRAELRHGPLTFRHIAQDCASGEISGHYHPKARIGLRGSTVTRPCFLVDDTRIIMPAFGTYTGGLASSDPILANLLGPKALAILTGTKAIAVPMPREKTNGTVQKKSRRA